MSLLEEFILRFVLGGLGLSGSIVSSTVSNHQLDGLSELASITSASHILVGVTFAVISVWLASWAAVCVAAKRRSSPEELAQIDRIGNGR